MALNGLWQRLTWLDRIIVAGLLTFCVFLFVLIGFSEPGESIQVEQDGKIIFTAPLSVDRHASLQGPLGVTELVISEGQAWISSSPCPFKVCIGMGTISRSGQLIACVPNRLLVQVAGADQEARESGYDLLSR